MRNAKKEEKRKEGRKRKREAKSNSLSNSRIENNRICLPFVPRQLLQLSIDLGHDLSMSTEY
jgi:hypothetical protein